MNTAVGEKERQTKSKAIPAEHLMPAVKSMLDEGHTATFRIRGRSMRPFLEDCRDRVILAPCDGAGVEPGDAVLAEINPGVYVFHRVVSHTGDTVTLRGDGNVYGTESCHPSHVIGRATGFLRKGRSCPDSTSGVKWRLYSFLWPSSSFLRRIFLAFHRRIILRWFPSRIKS